MPDQPDSMRGDKSTAQRMRDLQRFHCCPSRRQTLHCLLAFAESEPLRFARLVREETKRMRPGGSAAGRKSEAAMEG